MDWSEPAGESKKKIDVDQERKNDGTCLIQLSERERCRRHENRRSVA